MISKQGALVNILVSHGIHLTTSDRNKKMKEFNNFRMPISELTKSITNDPKEFIEYLKS